MVDARPKEDRFRLTFGPVREPGRILWAVGALRAVAEMRSFCLVALPDYAFRTLVVINGRGWGHGIGLSQWGAEGYARHGWRFRRILPHFYPHTTIESAHSEPVRVLLTDSASKVAAARNPSCSSDCAVT